jgi:hypothetical protein
LHKNVSLLWICQNWSEMQKLSVNCPLGIDKSVKNLVTLEHTDVPDKNFAQPTLPCTCGANCGQKRSRA